MKTDAASYMEQALCLGASARGLTAPNPMVGSVLVSADGAILGRGFHPKAGEPHAEVFALREALSKNADLSGCTLFVTLEPCNHSGRTPPCTDLIISSGIKKVVVGVLDPHPLMNGKSIKLLQAAGVNVEVGVLEKNCKKLIRGFETALRHRRPFVTIKAATSLDGKIATSTGESKWITDEKSRALAHEERAEHDAILVGVGTVLADDPQLTARHQAKNERLKKVILDSRLLTPPSAKIFDSDSLIFIYCDASYSGERRKALESAGATVIPMPARSEDFSEPGYLDLKAVFFDLTQRGVQELLVEGGARVLGAIVREQLFDRIVYFLAPKILGSTSKDVFEGLNVASLSSSVKIENVSARLIGQDVVIEGNRVHGTH